MNVIKKKEMKSVKSIYPCKSVIQTMYDIVKAHDGELKVETLSADEAGKEAEGSTFIISIPFNQ